MANLYAEAQENAARVGSGLRPMITGLNLPVLNLLTFSLGASVAAHALYNIRPDSQPTPENRMVNICLMAPAIGGESWFQNYTIRNHNYQPKPDRYRICIAWNKNDFVLKKKDPKTGLLGPGPYKYGNTSLGCNHKGAVEKLKQYFKIHHPDSFITDVDLSETGKCHLIRCYASAENARKISSFFNMQ